VFNTHSNRVEIRKEASINNFPTIKPSDAVAWSECFRRVWLDNKDLIDLPKSKDAFDELIIEQGLLHEKQVLSRLSEKHIVTEAKSVEHTKQLMDKGAEVIYQARLENKNEKLIGFPDFLIRGESGKYQAADAKLSRSSNKKNIQIQLGFYRKLLATELPALVYLGDGSISTIGDEANEITDQFILEMRELLLNEVEPSVRYSHSKCRACPYYDYCMPKFENSQDLSLLYGIQGRAADGLEKAGIESISMLANSDPETLPDVPYLKGAEKKRRATLQAKSYLFGDTHQFDTVQLPQGQWVHFDIEDNPLAKNGDKHVYLWGFLVSPFGKENFEYIWTDKEEDDEKGWIGFLNQVEKYRSKYKDLVLAHFAAHERSTIISYAKRYGMEQNDTVLYLLGDNSPLYDMQKPVLDNLVLPLKSYGLKEICKHSALVNFQWEDDNSGSQWSVVQFNRFLQEKSAVSREQLKTEILRYNQDDVFATRRLEEWLRTNFEESSKFCNLD